MTKLFNEIRLNTYVALVLLRDKIKFFKIRRERVRAHWAGSR